MIGKSSLFARNVISSLVRHGSHGGTPGENLPFQIQNRFRLSALFIAFFGTGFAAPFFVLRHQLTKK